MSGKSNEIKRSRTAKTSLIVILALLLAVASLATGCHRSTFSSWYTIPPTAHNSEALFLSQVINPEAPRDPSPVRSLPGHLAADMYQNRYIVPMTEEMEDDDDETVADEMDSN